MPTFVKVATRSEVGSGDKKMVEAEGQKIVVANLGGSFIAFDNECTHAGCDLADGELDGEELTCICHGSRFQVTTGAVLGGPAKRPVKVYQVRLEGDDIPVGL